jgi:hypothetical protein
MRQAWLAEAERLPPDLAAVESRPEVRPDILGGHIVDRQSGQYMDRNDR